METTTNMNMIETMEKAPETMKEEMPSTEMYDPKSPAVATPEPSAAMKKAMVNKNKGLCKALLDGSLVCTHPVCFYAHCLEEWVLPQCDYGDKCRWILHSRDGVVNKPNRHNRQCGRMHGDEDPESFFYRVGLTHLIGAVVKSEPRKAEPVSSKPIKSVHVKPDVKSDEETTLEFPRAMALEVLKMMMQSGKNVKVEFK
jgi:hypothetical protein